MIKDKNIQQLDNFLAKIGLSQYERAVYLSLIDLKEASVHEINKRCSVPLPKIYETLNELSYLNLIKLVSNKPKKYKIVHPGKFINNFIKSREFDLLEIKKEKDKILKLFSFIPREKKYKFELMQGKEAVIESVAKTVESSSKSYWAVITFTTFPNPMIPVLKRKIKQGLEAKILGPSGKEETAYKYRAFGAKVKIINILDGITRFSIHDKRYLYFTFPDVEKNYTSLFTDSPYLVKKMIELFNYYWKRGKELK